MPGLLATSLLAAALAHAPPAWPHARLLAQAGPEAGALDALTYPQLQAEYARLDTARPGLVGPIVLVAGSEVGLAMAADLLYTGIGFGFGTTAGTGVASGSSSGWPLVVAGAVLLVAGVGIGVYGALRLYRTLRLRSELGAQMDRVREKMTDPSAAPKGAVSAAPAARLVLAAF